MNFLGDITLAHYVVLGAILGTAFPYLVRDRFTARKWLFERTPDGSYRIRGARTQRWLGWPKQIGPEGARLFGHSGRNSPENPPH